MRVLNQLFTRLLVYPFYEAHVLPFTFAALVIGGCVDASQQLYFHYSILSAGFSSAAMFGVLALVWLVYIANGFRFVWARLHQTDYHFLTLAPGAGKRNTLFSLLFTICYIDLPVILYGIAGILVGIHNHQYLTTGLCLLFFLFVIGIQVQLIYSHWTNAHRLPLIDSPQSLFNIRVKPSIFSITLRQLSIHNKAAIPGIKVFSCLILYAAHFEWHIFEYDIRWMQLALCLVLAANGILVKLIWDFDSRYLFFTRGFATTLLSRLGQFGALMFVFILPEMALLSSYAFTYGETIQMPVYLLFIFSVVFFQFAILHTMADKSEEYNGMLFALALIFFFVSLLGYNVPLSAVLGVVSILIYRDAFYKFERQL
jgi:hypothetical protein